VIKLFLISGNIFIEIYFNFFKRENNKCFSLKKSNKFLVDKEAKLFIMILTSIR